MASTSLEDIVGKKGDFLLVVPERKKKNARRRRRPPAGKVQERDKIVKGEPDDARHRFSTDSQRPKP